MILEKKKTAEPLLDIVRGVTESNNSDDGTPDENFKGKHFTAIRANDHHRLYGIIEHTSEDEAKEVFLDRNITQPAGRNELNRQDRRREESQEFGI